MGQNVLKGTEVPFCAEQGTRIQGSGFMTVTSLSALGGRRLPASGGLRFQKSDL